MKDMKGREEIFYVLNSYDVAALEWRCIPYFVAAFFNRKS
jgi:hypothetical protein